MTYSLVHIRVLQVSHHLGGISHNRTLDGSVAATGSRGRQSKKQVLQTAVLAEIRRG